MSLLWLLSPPRATAKQKQKLKKKKKHICLDKGYVAGAVRLSIILLFQTSLKSSNTAIHSELSVVYLLCDTICQLKHNGLQSSQSFCSLALKCNSSVHLHHIVFPFIQNLNSPF
ncbi:hypothetical protein ILYODFUR_034441 [Ilyodon furcidens]|uniref:Uncharacterized protein n=1 Tax=Ilyodon furcidens TaxID=33524 RepID=A0ABV0UMV3_9TELE